MSNSNSIPLPTHGNFKDLTGKVFTRLTVTAYAGKGRGGVHRWTTRCTCGAVGETTAGSLRIGDAKSCGCLSAENTAKRNRTHDLSKLREYRILQNVWQRCTNPKNPHYSLYKNFAPPPEWRSFEVFFAELGPRPGPEYSIDRIDNDKPYGPGNCRWTTQHTQTRNMSRNVWVTTPDGQRLCLKDACALVGVVYGTVTARRSSGQSIEEASNWLLREAA